MRAGYVVSGVVFVSLATIFGLVALFLGVFYGIAYAGTSCVTAASSSPTLVAQCNAYTAGLVVSSAAALIFYSVGALFMWNGFKTPTITSHQVVTVMQPVMSICPNCKAQVSPGQRFCPNCGTKLT